MIWDSCTTRKDQDRLTAEVMATGSVDDREVKFVNRQGMPGINLVSMRVVTLKKKQYCLTVMQDITELKVLEQQMDIQQRRVKQIRRRSQADQ